MSELVSTNLVSTGWLADHLNDVRVVDASWYMPDDKREPAKEFEQAHIPGSEYIGPASSESGPQQLRKRVASLPRNQFIVIYCGCCPWSHCPNVKPAADALRAMGFTNAKVLFIADNFGANWVEKGYAVARGE